MEWLNVSGSVASLVGLLVAFYTLYKVTALPAALKQHSREQHLLELVEKVLKVPEARTKIANSTVREVEQILKITRLYYVSRIPFKHRTLKSLLDDLETEIKDQKQRAAVQSQVQLIYDEITIR